jgi:2-polyprenyl-6-methoxyphenol hydroxylase-like FAD-dependent oxidoreductase
MNLDIYSVVADMRIAFKVCDKNMRTYIHMEGSKGPSSTRGRPEIDRMQLRQLLIDSLPPKTIRWGRHLNKVEAVDGVFKLHFNHGVEDGFDLIIGADGAWSHVRSVLTDVKPEYSGVSGVRLTISKPQERCPDLYKLVNRGSMFAYSDSMSIMAQQQGTGEIGVSTWSAADEDSIARFQTSLDDPDVVKELLKQDRKGWDSKLLGLLDAADGPLDVRNLYQLPIGTRWDSQPCITLMGDAAHLTTPFAGEGVNLAMTDAMKLSAAIIKAAEVGTQEALTEGIRAYEEDMFIRATKVQKLTHTMMSLMFFTPNAPEETIERWVIAAASDGMHPVLLPGFKLFIYAYFWFWKRFHPISEGGGKVNNPCPETSNDQHSTKI